MKKINLETARSFIGNETGVSDWVNIDQGMINGFADITRDWQFIHVDPEKAKASPFGRTIAHGFLTLSFLSHFAETAALSIEGARMLVNYGFDKLRFLSPVPSGARIRGKFVLKDMQERAPGQILFSYTVTVEVEGEEKPALMADWLMLFIFDSGQS
ncbi:MaoC family dehydratase [Emcibacter sp.]|uniref:MaoC family dehydratase n=1 Tax=Emcibacter sp. TaxID=1979954 RepID=UPI003A8D96FA